MRILFFYFMTLKTTQIQNILGPFVLYFETGTFLRQITLSVSIDIIQ